jgi:hypothetical protein
LALGQELVGKVEQHAMAMYLLVVAVVQQTFLLLHLLVAVVVQQILVPAMVAEQTIGEFLVE